MPRTLRLNAGGPVTYNGVVNNAGRVATLPVLMPSTAGGLTPNPGISWTALNATLAGTLTVGAGPGQNNPVGISSMTAGLYIGSVLLANIPLGPTIQGGGANNSPTAATVYVFSQNIMFTAPIDILPGDTISVPTTVTCTITSPQENAGGTGTPLTLAATLGLFGSQTRRV